MFYDQNRLMCHFLFVGEDWGSIQSEISKCCQNELSYVHLWGIKKLLLVYHTDEQCKYNLLKPLQQTLKCTSSCSKMMIALFVGKDTCRTCWEVNKTTNTRALLSVWNFLETTYHNMRKFLLSAVFQNHSMLAG